MIKRSYINPISNKQRDKNKHWKEVTDERAEEEGYVCQVCHKGGGQRQDPNGWFYLDGHHIQLRSRGRVDTKENCYICHRIPCHQSIHDHTIDLTRL